MQEIQNAYDALQEAERKLYSLKAPEYVGPFAQQAKRRFYVQEIQPAMKEVDRLETEFVKIVRNSDYDELFEQFADITRRYE